MPVAKTWAMITAARLELATGVVIDDQAQGVKATVLGAPGPFKAQAPLPKVLANPSQVKIGIKGIPAPAARMHRADHRNAFHGRGLEMLFGMVRKRLNGHRTRALLFRS